MIGVAFWVVILLSGELACADRASLGVMHMHGLALALILVLAALLAWAECDVLAAVLAIVYSSAFTMLVLFVFSMAQQGRQQASLAVASAAPALAVLVGAAEILSGGGLLPIVGP